MNDEIPWMTAMKNSWTVAEQETLRLLWAGTTAREIAEQLPGRTRNSVIGMARRLGLPKIIGRQGKHVYQGPVSTKPDRKSQGSRLRKAYASKGDDTTLSRWVKVPPAERDVAKRQGPRSNGQAWFPDMKHEVLRTGRSIFHRKGVTKVEKLKNLLVSAHSNAKIGRDVRKGLFLGYRIFTLSFEERATCPRSCQHWQTCYGNNMPYATRVDHTDFDALTRRLEREINSHLTGKWPGILVRLHALGDFFSVDYVEFWRRMLSEQPRLAVYGYTARNAVSDPIGRSLELVKREFGPRFAVRWSDGGFDADCTVSRKDETVPLPGSAFQCPEQAPGFTAKGKPILCATCGLCWSTTKNVAFLEH